jgi:hypothetical protein
MTYTVAEMRAAAPKWMTDRDREMFVKVWQTEGDYAAGKFRDSCAAMQDPTPDERALLRKSINLANGHTPDPNGYADATRYKRWSITELLAADLTYQWDATGLLVRPTYGADSGELKTLKSYFGDARAVGLASRLPVLGHWHVPERRRVLMYVAEGGRIPWTRRLVRMCDAYGIGPEELDGWLETIYVSGPLDSAGFRDGLTGHLEDFQPHLVHLDPLYPFHPMSVDSNRLAQVGAMLNEVQRICADHDASFWVTAHMNQTGSGFDLKRISGAGISEWADSWVLLKHRTDPDVDGGHFRLTADIGSRQWGGTTVDVDFDIGRFDAETGTHDGPIRFKVRTRRTDGAGVDKDAELRLKARRAVVKTGRTARKPLSKEELAERTTGVSKTHIRAEIAVMIEQHLLVRVDVRKNPRNGVETPLYSISELDLPIKLYKDAEPEPEPDPTLDVAF